MAPTDVSGEVVSKPNDIGKVSRRVSREISQVIEVDGTKDISTKSDDELLRLQGHEAVLERKFTIWSAFGLAFSVTGSWAGYLSSFGQNLIYGGPQMVIFPLLVATVVQGLITTGLAELASAFPSTGGQYHYAYLLAPAEWKRPVAYFTGLFSVLGWWIVTTSGCFLATTSTQGLVSFWVEGYVAERWHAYLIFLGVILVTSSPLFIAPRKVGWFTEACLYISVSGCFVVLVMSCAMHQRFYPSPRLIDNDLGTSGWSYSVAWLLSIANSMYAYGGTDAASHVAEEIPHPNKRVPLLMIGSIVLGFITAFPLMTVLMFTMSDQNSVSGAALPSLELFYQTTGSKTAATIMQVWVLVVYYDSLCSQWIASGRIVWALARDGGVPFPRYFSYVDKSLEFPVRTTVLTMIFCSLYGLIYLASTNAFNSIVTSAVLYLNISYAIPQVVLLSRGRSILPKAPFRLGRFGTLCNVFSPVAVVAITILSCFPAGLPTSVGSMNYSSAVLAGLLLLITGIWLTIGKDFEGPAADLEAMGML
ncbi:hypothetical protein M426DRAFT_203070 [Hypoxylon sp. CI-4A]|nr:hypothetical protein M426DRAFT_203070 [Hypoxylon sp. CI-4A]